MKLPTLLKIWLIGLRLPSQCGDNLARASSFEKGVLSGGFESFGGQSH
jgi:hypothetical protein